MSGKGSKRGFTLVELIVVVAVTVMIATALATLLVPAVRVFTQSVSLSQSSVMADGICSQVEGYVMYATQIEAQEDSISFVHPLYGSMRVENRDGRVSILAGDVDIAYDAKYTMGREGAASFSLSGNLLTIRAQVSDGQDTIALSRPVILMNLAS